MGSEKVLERVLGEGSQKGSEKGARCGFYSKKGCEKVSQKGSEKGVSRMCLERPLEEYAPLGVRPAKAGKRNEHTSTRSPRNFFMVFLFNALQPVPARRSNFPIRGEGGLQKVSFASMIS